MTDRVAAELDRVGLTVVRAVAAHYPHALPTLATPWYDYACVKHSCSNERDA